jgi:transposase
MRKGIESLASIVELEFGMDPFAQATYVFVSRRADKIKLLKWDINGFWLYYKKLSRGLFRWVFDDDYMLLEVDPRQLGWLIDGLSVDQPQAHRKVNQRIMF